MNTDYAFYSGLISRFLGHELSVERFQRVFLAHFKRDTCTFDQQLFDLLDELFGDLDAYAKDAELIAEQPGFYLNEDGLRARVKNIAERMAALEHLEPKRSATAPSLPARPL